MIDIDWLLYIEVMFATKTETQIESGRMDWKFWKIQVSNSYLWILQKTSKNGCQGGVFPWPPSQQPKPIEHSGATSTATPMGKAGQNLGHLGHDFTPLEPENDDGFQSPRSESPFPGENFF